jgi:hypothetical protein
MAGIHNWCSRSAVSLVAQVFELAGGPKAPVPPPRTGHCATVYQDKYLVVFGGEGGEGLQRPGKGLAGGG